MLRRIRIVIGETVLDAALNESQTADEIWEALPFEAEANVWGDEIYFEIPATLSQTPDARVEVEVGALAYWPIGHAFCIFYGRTPSSTDDQPRAYSPVNIFGEVEGDVAQLRGTTSGTSVSVTRL